MGGCATAPAVGWPGVRARNAAVLTPLWHAAEQNRRVPLREVST